jgi:hypothetical protein
MENPSVVDEGYDKNGVSLHCSWTYIYIQSARVMEHGDAKTNL